MLVYISIAYCIAYFAVQFVCVLSNKKIKRIDFYWLLFFFAALIFIGYHLEPGKSDDLYRHYGVVNWYRAGRHEINIKKNILPISEAEQLYVYQLICWLVSLQEKNAYLQVIYLGIDFFCIIKMIRSFANRVKLDRKIVALYILIYFTLTPFFYSYSGLRFSTICHIMGLGFYKYYYEKDGLINLIFRYIVSILIHPATGIYLMVQIWYEITKNKKFVFAIIGLWGTSAKFLAKLLQYIPVHQIRYAGVKLYYYFESYEADFDVRKLLAQIMLLVLIIVVLYSDAVNKGSTESCLARIYIIIALLGLGSRKVMFLDRILMMMGPLLLIYLYSIFRKSRYRSILYVGMGAWIILMNVYCTMAVFVYFNLVV